MAKTVSIEFTDAQWAAIQENFELREGPLPHPSEFTEEGFIRSILAYITVEVRSGKHAKAIAVDDEFST